MNLTYHIQLRYVQRIKGIKKERDAATYLLNHSHEVFYHTSQIIKEANLIAERFSPEGAGSTYNYYISGENMLVVQSYNTREWITLYPIELEKNKKLNIQLIQVYLRHLRHNNEETNKLKALKESKDYLASSLERQLDEMLSIFGENYPDNQVQSYINELKKRVTTAIQEALKTTMSIRELKRDSRQVLDKLLFGFKEKLDEAKTM